MINRLKKAGVFFRQKLQMLDQLSIMSMAKVNIEMGWSSGGDESNTCAIKQRKNKLKKNVNFSVPSMKIVSNVCNKVLVKIEGKCI